VPLITVGRGELGFVLAKEATDSGLLPARAVCATVWALLLATLLGPFAFRLSLKMDAAPRRASKGDAATVDGPAKAQVSALRSGSPD
jgi:hypothetical protein